MQIPKCTRLATYVGPTGRTSPWPMTEDMEAPASVTMPSGEVRTLVVIAYEDGNGYVPAPAAVTTANATIDHIAAARAEMLRGAA